MRRPTTQSLIAFLCLFACGGASASTQPDQTAAAGDDRPQGDIVLPVREVALEVVVKYDETSRVTLRVLSPQSPADEQICLAPGNCQVLPGDGAVFVFEESTPSSGLVDVWDARKFVPTLTIAGASVQIAKLEIRFNGARKAYPETIALLGPAAQRSARHVAFASKQASCQAYEDSPQITYCGDTKLAAATYFEITKFEQQDSTKPILIASAATQSIQNEQTGHVVFVDDHHHGGEGTPLWQRLFIHYARQKIPSIVAENSEFEDLLIGAFYDHFLAREFPSIRLAMLGVAYESYRQNAKRPLQRRPGSSGRLIFAACVARLAPHAIKRTLPIYKQYYQGQLDSAPTMKTLFERVEKEDTRSFLEKLWQGYGVTAVDRCLNEGIGVVAHSVPTIAIKTFEKQLKLGSINTSTLELDKGDWLISKVGTHPIFRLRDLIANPEWKALDKKQRFTVTLVSPNGKEIRRDIRISPNDFVGVQPRFFLEKMEVNQ